MPALVPGPHRPRRTVVFAGLTGALMAGVCACSGAQAPHEAPRASTPPASSEASKSADPSSDAPEASAVSEDVAGPAITYLTAREGSIGAADSKDNSWVSKVRPVMTRTGWRALSEAARDDAGFAEQTARENHWSVDAQVACQTNPDAGVATQAQVTLTCDVTDRTVGQDGQTVAPADLPNVWPYNGPQPPAILSMQRVRGQWLVDADMTGQAG